MTLRVEEISRMAENSKVPRNHAVMLAVLAVGMFGFAFALVPLYQVFCEVTGLNGKTAGPVDTPISITQFSDREVKIQFLGFVNKDIPWDFSPKQHSMTVKLESINTTEYYARNYAAQAVSGRAVPSVSPGEAAEYLHKVECFCFSRQQLEEGEDVWMPLKFYLDANFPEDVHTITLSYTLYKVPDIQTSDSISMISEFQ
jgi:cytochrome c oxidase assembly protein subunit 11